MAQRARQTKQEKAAKLRHKQRTAGKRYKKGQVIFHQRYGKGTYQGKGKTTGLQLIKFPKIVMLLETNLERNEVTERQYTMLQAMRAVNSDSLWGEAIQLMCKFNWHRVDEMLEQLRSQAEDNPLVMRSILGDQYDVIIHG